MKDNARVRINADYLIVFALCMTMIALAFLFDAPERIWEGYWRIHLSRSVLVTDYIGLGGVGAALINSAVSGIFFLILLVGCGREPDGKIIASLWTTIGFSLFGKNLANTLPILTGVWLYGRLNKVPFKELFVQAMLSATIAPLVSEIAFLRPGIHAPNILAACAAGVFVGFIFPVVTEATKRVNQGYCLYNCGMAGGFIATFCVGLLRSIGIEIQPELIWDTSHTAFFAIFAYGLSLLLIAYGLLRDGPGRGIRECICLLKDTSHDDNDYLAKYGAACYINIGGMCALATSAMLLLKIPLNGPTLGGIFTVAGFAASGKHMMNTVPILLGSILATYMNHLEQSAPANSLAILFSTGLAPIAGQFGWIVGFAVGFLHVSVAIFIGQLNGGLNLYNNGFAGGFVVITVVPLIVYFRGLARKKRYISGAL